MHQKVLVQLFSGSQHPSAPCGESVVWDRKISWYLMHVGNVPWACTSSYHAAIEDANARVMIDGSRQHLKGRTVTQQSSVLYSYLGIQSWSRTTPDRLLRIDAPGGRDKHMKEAKEGWFNDLDLGLKLHQFHTPRHPNKEGQYVHGLGSFLTTPAIYGIVFAVILLDI